MKTTTENARSTPHHFVYDVIISGAGPVGLFLGCELALAGCSVLILEKTAGPHSPLKQLPFGIRGLNSLSVEALYRRGLLDELEIHKTLKNPHQHAVQGPRRQAGHFAGIPFHDGDIDTSQWKYRLPASTETSLMTSMEELEKILAHRAEFLGAEIIRGQAVTDFHQTGDGVVVHSGDRCFRGKWLAGCDGSRSIVRKKSGFEFAGTEPEFTGYSAKVEIADPEKLRPGRNMTAKGMYLQSQPGYLNIQDFDGGAFHHADTPVTRERIQEVLRRVSDTDVTITALHIASTWTDRARQATSYRKGRVFLAGDAAHIHAPLGGQGLNLGLGDAMNLGWKLAATIGGKAADGLLDSYHNERHPAGEQVLDWSRAQAAIMKPEPDARALNAIVRDLINTRDGATYIAGRVWGINSKYDLGGRHPLVGRSVPNFLFEDGTTLGDLMHDGRGILLDFNSNSSLETLAAGYADQFSYYSRPAEDKPGLSVMLIRPDGIVAFASGNDGDEREFREAADRWFVYDSVS